MTETSAPSRFPQAPAHATSLARRTDVGRQITSERIDEHLAAFRAAGGVVEVLGNTPLHKPWRAATRSPAKPTE